MTATPSFPAVSGAATFQHIRKDLKGLLARDTTGAIRTGVIPYNIANVVTGLASMNVQVADCSLVLDRSGVLFMANDGVATVGITAAPASGSRCSIIYAKQLETEAPFSDASAGPVIDKVESTTSEAAARALLPVGALELAVVQVNAGATATNGIGVTITQTYRYTGFEGSIIPVRNATELAAWTPMDSTEAMQMDLGIKFRRLSGTWRAWDSDWINYTPTTSIVVGTGGTIVSRYRYVAGRVLVQLKYTLGSSGYSFNGNRSSFTLPVTRAPLSHAYEASPELGVAFDLSAPATYRVSVIADGSSTSQVAFSYGLPQASADVSGSTPFAVANGDVFEATFSYDPA